MEELDFSSEPVTESGPKLQRQYIGQGLQGTSIEVYYCSECGVMILPAFFERHVEKEHYDA